MKINDILTIYDKILIAFVIFLSLFLLIIPFYYFSSDSDEDLVLKVQLKDELIRTVSLAESYEQPLVFEVEGAIGTHIIEVNQGRVRVQEAPAADPLKICEKTGWIDQPGPIIVCVPNSLSLWLESSNTDLDGMSW